MTLTDYEILAIAFAFMFIVFGLVSRYRHRHRKRSKPAEVIDNVYGCGFNDGPEPKLDRVNREDAARPQ